MKLELKSFALFEAEKQDKELSESIKEKIAEYKILKEKRDSLEKSFKDYLKANKKHMETTQTEIIEALEKLKVSEVKVDKVIVKITKSYGRDSIAWTKVIEMCMSKLNDATKKCIQMWIDANTSKGKDKESKEIDFEVTEGIKETVNSFVEWIKKNVKKFIFKINSYVNELEKINKKLEEALGINESLSEKEIEDLVGSETVVIPKDASVQAVYVKWADSIEKAKTLGGEPQKLVDDTYTITDEDNEYTLLAVGYGDRISVKHLYLVKNTELEGLRTPQETEATTVGTSTTGNQDQEKVDAIMKQLGANN